MRIAPDSAMVARPGLTIPYGFAELIEPIADRIAELHWSVTGTVVFSAAQADDFPDDETLEGLFLDSDENDSETPVWERAWLKPGGLEILAPFIEGDWTDIVGVEKLEGLSIAEVDVLDSQWLEDNARVYFTCVDAAFWAVFAPDTEVLSRLRSRFPKSTDIELEDRWW